VSALVTDIILQEYVTKWNRLGYQQQSAMQARALNSSFTAQPKPALIRIARRPK
jgi:hypothetical protein